MPVMSDLLSIKSMGNVNTVRQSARPAPRPATKPKTSPAPVAPIQDRHTAPKPQNMGTQDVRPISINDSDAKTPSDLAIPSYLMAPPFTYDTKAKNNTWMSEEDEPVNLEKAMRQWQQLYKFLVSADGLVYLLPSGGDYQDQIFIANLGIVLPHLEKPTVVLSKYASKPRQGEEDVGKDFFEDWNIYNVNKYDIHMCPIDWEGEAELKWLHDNVYIGGYGTEAWSRTKKEAFDWFDKTFKMKTIQVNMTDEKLYHLDCLIFPLTSEKTLVCTEILTPQEVREIEKETEIIDVSQDDAWEGATNCVRIHNTILVASDLKTLKQNTQEYKDERDMVENLEHVCTENGMELVVVNMDEMGKGGAALSCNVMHMNQASHAEELL